MREDEVLAKQARREGRTTRWLVAYPRAVPVGIFLAITAITSLSVFAIERGEAQRDDSLMREAAQSVSSALDRRGATSSSYLRAGAALFATVDDVDLDLFRRFVSELRLDSEYRGADGIGWAAAVQPSGIPDFEAKMAEEIPIGIKVSPANSEEMHFPVTYLEPDTARNRRALGFDMYSEPTRREAMDEAVQMVRPTASGKIVLLQEGADDAPGFLIYMPVFDTSSPGRDLKGFIYSPFNAQQFLESALEIGSLGGRGVRLYDGEADPENLLASHDPDFSTGRILRREVRIANRPLLLEIESNRANMLSTMSMITLIFGLALASLLMLLARLLAQQAKEDERAMKMLEEQNSIRNSLARELNHRVKNTLANVLSIMSLTRRRTDDLDTFADGLEERVRALSATHSLLTQSEWGTTPVRAIIEEELAPYVADPERQVELTGPEVNLAPNDALSLGMAIHELSTNAAKYGALSTQEGRVSVNWNLLSENLVQVEWRESHGPEVSALREPGFGTELIEKIVAHELKHPVDLKFESDGVVCVLRVPVRSRGEFRIRANPYGGKLTSN